MGEVGRPRIPRAVKKLNGTYRHDRDNFNEMLPEKLEFAPEPPDFLDEKAAIEWHSVCADLLKLNMLHRVDLALLSAYCQEMAVYIKASEQLMRNGHTIDLVKQDGNLYSMPSPWNSIKNQALKNAQALGGQFGFTPSSRAKIKAEGAALDDGFDDEL